MKRERFSDSTGLNIVLFSGLTDSEIRGTSIFLALDDIEWLADIWYETDHYYPVTSAKSSSCSSLFTDMCVHVFMFKCARVCVCRGERCELIKTTVSVISSMPGSPQASQALLFHCVALNATGKLPHWWWVIKENDIIFDTCNKVVELQPWEPTPLVHHKNEKKSLRQSRGAASHPTAITPI